jgi:hypothetical protein
MSISSSHAAASTFFIAARLKPCVEELHMVGLPLHKADRPMIDCSSPMVPGTGIAR